MIEIRVAIEDDAEAACVILRRSIVELCIADHLGDGETLRAWLENKTPENVLKWIRSDGQRFLVAEEDGKVLGVGAGSVGGEVTLNYVSPDARNRGVSKAILASLEVYFRDMGNKYSTLISTRTVHQFYLAAGYQGSCDNELTNDQSMEKTL